MLGPQPWSVERLEEGTEDFEAVVQEAELGRAVGHQAWPLEQQDVGQEAQRCHGRVPQCGQPRVMPYLAVAAAQAGVECSQDRCTTSAVRPTQ